MTSGRQRLAGLGRRLVAARDLATSARLRPWLLGGAALAFVAITVASFVGLPDAGRHPRLWPLVPLVVVFAPAMVLVNALEYRVIARMAGQAVGHDEAVRVTLLASVANYLPAPGGVAVRVGALHRRGSPLGVAVRANVVAGVVWLGTTALAAGVALLVTGDLPAGTAAALGVAGGAATLGGLLAQHRSSARQGGDDVPTRGGTRLRSATDPWAWQLVGIEAATVLIAAGRVDLALRALGQPVSFGAALCVSSSIVLAAVVGLAPAGLGLRELVAGGIAATVGLAASVAVAASAIDRLTFQLGVILTAGAFGVGPRQLRRVPGLDQVPGPGSATSR